MQAARPMDLNIPAPASSRSAYALTRLCLSNYRSYASVAIACDARPVVLAGENGAGKTNVLEAISWLSPGRGLRGVPFIEACREMPNAPPAAWAVAATLVAPDGEFEAGTGISANSEGETPRRLVRINHAPSSGPAALTEIFSVLWLTPAMDRLFIEGASGRRKFLDRIAMGFAPAHAQACGAYERATRERLRLLRDGRGDPRWLDGLEAEMARHGSAMIRNRLHAVARLMEAMSEETSGFPAAIITLKGDAEALFCAEPEAAADAMAARLAKNRRLDETAGRTLFGPHRADLEVRHASRGREAASCSTGEQKALLISLILAAARAQSERAVPVLLLDEVAAHLDEARRIALFDAITTLGAQAWMTGTDMTMFSPLGQRAQKFRVGNGTIVPH